MMRQFGRAIGLIAAYALVLNVVLSAAVGAQAAATTGSVALEFCLPGGDSPPAGPAAPAQHAAKFHCVLCTTAGDGLALPLLIVAALLAPLESVPVAVLPVDQAVAPGPALTSTSPRGPPQQA
jgi:hypothetical protein